MRSILLATIAALGLSACDVEIAGGDNHSRLLRIINASDSAVVGFYGTRRADRYWGRNRLGGAVLPPNSMEIMDFDDGSSGCVFDFLVVKSSGSKRSYWNIDVCSRSEFRIR